MANQLFIAEKEEKLLTAFHTASACSEALEYEKSINGGFIYNENRDHWNTLFVNCQSLAKRLNKLIEQLDKAL